MPSAQVEAPQSDIVERTPPISEATGSKLYDNRAMLIIRLIRLNRILSAMTAFVDDLANPARKPFTSQQLESFVIALRVQSKQHPTTRPAPKFVESTTGYLWRPSMLDPSVSAKTLSIPAQCMYAMATIYDAGLERNLRPTSKMTSAMLSTFDGHLDAQQMLRAADNALCNLVPPEAHNPDACLRQITHSALASFIRVYGGIGKPELGEQLLRTWASAQRVGETHEDMPMLNADDPVDLAGWGNNAVIWTSLIRSRVDAADHEGARRWLDRYRLALQPSEKDLQLSSTPRLPTVPEPYLAYMAGIRRQAEAPRSSEAFIRRMSAKIGEVIRLMRGDGVPITSSTLAFILGFEAKVGRTAGGSALLEQASSIIRANVANDADLLQALFSFRRSIANTETASTTGLRGSSARAQGGVEGLPSTRSLLRSLVQVGEGEIPSSTENLAACRNRHMLNGALLAVMAEADYPAAIVVLNLFERWRITPATSTYRTVVNALLAQGHQAALFSNEASERFSESRMNLDTVLQSMARQGNNEQAETLRLALGDSSALSETSVTSAQPASPLRQTQYLIRTLNQACAAEITSTDASRTVPGWLTVRRNADREEPLSHDEAMKRVSFLVRTAQDELLGPKEQRKDNPFIGSSLSRSKGSRFATAPLLTPRRNGMEQPPKPARPSQPGTRTKPVSNGDKQRYMRISSARSAAARARAFSTSARAHSETGASCDLASATKGDYTHLPPVRAIYIPGFVPYDLGLALQEHLVKQRSDARAALRALSDSTSSSASTLSGHSSISPSTRQSTLEILAAQDTLLLLQHRPVYTEGRRHDTEDNLVATALRSLGADYHLTKRGGQITYHGPGQLVGYPILNLSSMNLASRCYVDKIQDSLISLLAARGILTVDPPENHTGVWADEYHKIASIGIQVRHRVSSHGFALNVEGRAMGGFRHIVACGIVGRNMTCLHDRLDPSGPFARHNPVFDGERDVKESVESVARSYKDHFASVFGRRVRETSEEEFAFELVEETDRARLREKLNVEVGEEERVVKSVMVDGVMVRVE
ncbi:Biotin/lipoate A/B protein ligase [Kalmanozyma brasiliensis GHG001]|uniref:Biotin/lipoate A/B protein ligase n=1 Tax=Kalmanozyma brasiliensis (strain GHG001) TaxID=1365824 RepID=UPI002867E541|nr:Biotin/lipoate A/B protein ligase [Kalmanozyma brasiliensis GHG001]EST07062.2 Biotin/lipoate A/B protein ligase [Kalmanozyma brasiliensis GHG001]